MEWLTTVALPNLLASENFSSWFFLRYWDEGGLHVRFRLAFQTQEYAREAKAAMEPMLDDILRHLQHLPDFGIYTPLIPKLCDYTQRSTRIGSPAVRLDTYKPEFNAFGRRGIAIAEGIFRLSSELALGTLIAEHHATCSRKTMGPLFMQAAASALAPNDVPFTFWTAYADYWLSGLPEELSKWKLRFRAKAEVFKRTGVHVLAQTSELSRVSISYLDRWRLGLIEANHSYANLSEPQSENKRMLAFQFIHLMNNRLGIAPLEEAYLATVLAEEESRQTL